MDLTNSTHALAHLHARTEAKPCVGSVCTVHQQAVRTVLDLVAALKDANAMQEGIIRRLTSQPTEPAKNGTWSGDNAHGSFCASRPTCCE